MGKPNSVRTKKEAVEERGIFSPVHWKIFHLKNDVRNACAGMLSTEAVNKLIVKIEEVKLAALKATYADKIRAAGLNPGDPSLYRELRDWKLSVRAQHAFIRADIDYICELCVRTTDQLLRMKNFGHVTLNEVREMLTTMNLHFADERPAVVSDRGYPEKSEEELL